MIVLRSRWYRLHAALLPCVFVGCGGAAEPATPPMTEQQPSADVSVAPKLPSCAASSTFQRSSKGGQGSSVVLARWGERDVAVLADADRRRVAVFDLVEKKVVGGVDVDGAPAELLMLDDGRVVVSLEDREAIVVLAASDSELSSVCTRQVPAGPTGLATDGAHVVVVSTAAATVSVLETAELTRSAKVSVPRLPRGVLLHGESVFVSHVAGSQVSEFSLEDPKHPVTSISTSLQTAAVAGTVEDFTLSRKASQAYSLVKVELPRAASEVPKEMRGAAPVPPQPATPSKPSVRSKIVVPMVSVDAGRRDGRFQNYYGPPPTAGVDKIAPTALSIDPIAKVALTKTITAQGREAGTRPCMLPRAAVAGARGKVYVACAGIDEVMELEGRRHDPLASYVRRFAVSPGPSGVALSEDDKRLVVFSQFETALTVVDLESGDPVAIPLDLGQSPLPLEHRVGRELFHRANDTRITSDGIACASCHPGGMDDGVVWQTPEGPRQTIALAGKLADTEPYGWTRGHTTLSGYIESTCSRLGGSGLPRDELLSLASYVRAVPAPPSAVLSDELVARGAKVFTEFDCGSCHVAHVGTNRSSHMFHGISQGPLSGRSESVDTPSLFRVGMTAPYFHDGRYATLEDLLGDSLSTMGRTSSLSAADREALAAFLRSL
jgi:DNA-binding beta-propeller fold protein YncE